MHPGVRIHLTLCGCSAVIYAPMEVKKGLKRLLLACPRWEKYSLSPPPFRSFKWSNLQTPPPPLPSVVRNKDHSPIESATPYNIKRLSTHSFLIRCGIVATHMVSMRRTHFEVEDDNLRTRRYEVLKKIYKFSCLAQSEWRKPASTPPPPPPPRVR